VKTNTEKEEALHRCIVNACQTIATAPGLLKGCDIP